MAKEVSKAETQSTPIGYDSSQFTFETVHEESADQIVLDTVGDEFTLLYTGSEVITFTDKKGEEQSFTQLRFRGPNGDAFVVNAGYDLRESFAKIEPQTITRVRLMKFVDVGQASPMAPHRIDVAKPNNSANPES
jgi:hypothetical protein